MNIRRQSGNIQFEEDLFSKNVQSIRKMYREVLLIMKFLQTKPQVKSMNNKYYDLYYTVIKYRDDNEIGVFIYENIDINFFDYITPNQNIGR